jgi:hypothetical protein
MFLDRTAEMADLEAWWAGGHPEIIAVYGRRQVGKTKLLVRFLAGEPGIYYYADRQPRPDQLRAFTEQVLALVDDPLLRLQPFASWEAALTYVLRLAERRRLVLVIDEFSYAVDADPALPSVVQRLWDSARRTGNRLVLVLCTSFTEAIERHFRLDAPLYQRRTRVLHVEPFSYRDAAAFFPDWPAADQLTAWGVAGGIPAYLRALEGATLAEAVVVAVLTKSAVLYREADTLLAQAVRGVGPALLRGMLQAIAHGATEPNQIARRVGRPVTSLSGALGFLVEAGLLARRHPYSVPNPERTRQTRYRLLDNYLAFWFRFVLPNRSALEQGQADYVWRVRILPSLAQYMGERFEEACHQYVRLTPGRWRHPVPELGRWWRADEELDLVGHDAGTVVLAGEAKWTDAPVGLETLRDLERRVARLPRVAPDRQLVLFSRGGFAPAVTALAGPDLVLIDLAAMLAP